MLIVAHNYPSIKIKFVDGPRIHRMYWFIPYKYYLHSFHDLQYLEYFKCNKWHSVVSVLDSKVCFIYKELVIPQCHFDFSVQE